MFCFDPVDQPGTGSSVDLTLGKYCVRFPLFNKFTVQYRQENGMKFPNSPASRLGDEMAHSLCMPGARCCQTYSLFSFSTNFSVSNGFEDMYGE